MSQRVTEREAVLPGCLCASGSAAAGPLETRAAGRTEMVVRPALPRLVTLLGLLALGWPLFGRSASFHEDTLHGRRAFVLENGKIRVSTLPGGGYFGEIRFKSDDPKKSVNPMRVPHYQTIDPYTFDIAKHGPLYGTGNQRLIMSGYMGHFLCFPTFGQGSEAELNHGFAAHGEALAVEWKQQKVETANGAVTLRYGADLPLTQFRVARAVTLLPDETVGYVEESVENLTSFDRPVQWVQHITFGPPFLEVGKTGVDAPVAKGVAGRLRLGPQDPPEGTWPLVKDVQGKTADLRLFSGESGTWLLDRSRPQVYFAMYNPDYPVLIGYIFPSATNPWVLDWQENQRAKQIPWDGKAIARGICIGDSPVEGLRNAVRRESIFGVPVYSWIEAGQRRTQNYAFFLAEIPLGFKGVDDLRVEAGKIVIVERETGKTITLASSRLR